MQLQFTITSELYLLKKKQVRQESKEESKQNYSFFSPWTWNWNKQFNEFGSFNDAKYKFQGKTTLQEAVNHLKVNGKNIQLPEVAEASILAIETKAADDGIYLDGFLNFLKDFHSCDNGTMVNYLPKIQIMQCQRVHT